MASCRVGEITPRHQGTTERRSWTLRLTAAYPAQTPAHREPASGQWRFPPGCIGSWWAGRWFPSRDPRSGDGSRYAGGEPSRLHGRDRGRDRHVNHCGVRGRKRSETHSDPSRREANHEPCLPQAPRKRRASGIGGITSSRTPVSCVIHPCKANFPHALSADPSLCRDGRVARRFPRGVFSRGRAGRGRPCYPTRCGRRS